MQGVGHATLRLVLGIVFIKHGLPKLVPMWGSRPEEAAALLDSVGLSPGYAIGMAIGTIEVLAGVLLIAGLYTLWSCVALALDMLGTLWVLHLRDGLAQARAVDPGGAHAVEHHVVLLAALVCLLMAGAGAFSLDGRRARFAEVEALGRARLRRS